MAETCATTGAGTAAVTSPAPARIAARDVMAGAPDLPSDPPTTSTWPKLPLCDEAALGVCVSACAEPAQRSPSVEIIASSGEPMGVTTTGWSHWRVSCPKTCAGLGAVKVITASAGKTGVLIVADVSSAGQPEGRSTARTGAWLL